MSKAPKSLRNLWSELKPGLFAKKYSRWSAPLPSPTSSISWFNNSFLTAWSHTVVKAWISLKLYCFWNTSTCLLKSFRERVSPFTSPIGSWDWKLFPSKTPAITNANKAIPITAIKTNEFLLKLPNTAIWIILGNENTNNQLIIFSIIKFNSEVPSKEIHK